MYLRLKRALYGCIQFALMWYKTFSIKLKQDYFVLNKYDPCVANKMIYGNQCTVCWYVGDTKILHKDTKVDNDVIKMIEERSGKCMLKEERDILL